MATKHLSPSTLLSPRRPLLPQTQTTAAHQTRHATLIPRPARPYHFTQLIQLSDGSTYTIRSTSPQALHRSTRDTRNHMMWQPSDKSLRNIEVDEAGKLAAFRARFGRGWDAASGKEGEEVEGGKKDGKKDKMDGKDGKEKVEAKEKEEGKKEEKKVSSFDALADLISGYAAKVEPQKEGRAQVVTKKSGKK